MKAVLLACVVLGGCATTRAVDSHTGPSPLVIASCPELTTVAPETFGGTVQMLITTSMQYNECRTAALAGRKTP